MGVTLFAGNHNIMKIIIRKMFGATVSLALVHSSCQVADKLPDGFYVQDESGKSPLKLVIKDTAGKNRRLAVCEYTNITVNSISVHSLRPFESAYQVQISVVASDTNWLKAIPILVIGSKTYLELSKSGTDAKSDIGSVKMSSIIALKINDESEAKLIKSKLSEKFKTGPP
jgi:hypothetical protein